MTNDANMSAQPENIADFNSNFNSTFIALYFYLLTDTKTHNARNQRL